MRTGFSDARNAKRGKTMNDRNTVFLAVIGCAAVVYILLRLFCKLIQGVTYMQNYNIYLSTEDEKYNVMRLARILGANITGVSGCGPGYYIQLQATPGQAHQINKRLGEAS